MATDVGTEFHSFLRSFMKKALKDYETQLQRDGLVPANVKERVAAAKKFMSFVFGVYRGKGKQPYF